MVVIFGFFSVFQWEKPLFYIKLQRVEFTITLSLITFTWTVNSGHRQQSYTIAY